MSLDVVALALAKKHANEVALGIGSMRVEGTTVYFTKIDTGEEVSITLPTPADGDDGVSINNIIIDDNNHLICNMSDGNNIDAGKIPTLTNDVESYINNMIDEKIDESIEEKVQEQFNYATDEDIDNLW